MARAQLILFISPLIAAAGCATAQAPEPELAPPATTLAVDPPRWLGSGPFTYQIDEREYLFGAARVNLERRHCRAPEQWAGQAKREAIATLARYAHSQRNGRRTRKLARLRATNAVVASSYFNPHSNKLHVLVRIDLPAGVAPRRPSFRPDGGQYIGAATMAAKQACSTMASGS